MSAAQRPWAADILHFWFRDLRSSQWFGASAEVDAACERRFERWLKALSKRPASDFLRDRLTARAAVLLFDQMPRNIHRGSAKAFATDALARTITKGAIARGWDAGLTAAGRQFLYMPLMHSEDRADQRVSLRLFTTLGDARVTSFARDHAAMIARFGRFPHRNAVLGRSSSLAERRAVAAGNAW